MHLSSSDCSKKIQDTKASLNNGEKVCAVFHHSVHMICEETICRLEESLNFVTSLEAKCQNEIGIRCGVTIKATPSELSFQMDGWLFSFNIRFPKSQIGMLSEYFPVSEWDDYDTGLYKYNRLEGLCSSWQITQCLTLLMLKSASIFPVRVRTSPSNCSLKSYGFISGIMIFVKSTIW